MLAAASMPAHPLPRSQDAPDDAGDTLIDGLVERSIAPYRRFLSPAEQVELRDLLGAVFASHPAVAPVVNRLRQRRTPDRSGTQPTPRAGRK